MRKAFSLILSILILAPAFGVYAQQYSQEPVTVSKDKIRGSDGKVYYSHVVHEKQTLFSIAHAYGVTLDEICDANKELDLKKQGLKKDSVLKIPVTSTDSSKPVVVEERPEPSQEVQKKSKKKTFDTLKTHVVKWYEDIESIAKKYGVSVEDLINVNKLKNKKLKSRMVLKIPEGKSEDAETLNEDPKETVIEPETKDQGEKDIEEPSPKERVNVALLLPLDADGSPSSASFDFYSGFLLAVKDLGAKGISTDLSVVDVAKSQVSEELLSESDVVIGPVSEKDLTKILSLNKGRVPIVSPLDQKAETLVAGNENFIQSPTPADVQYKDLARWISQSKKSGDKVLVISESTSQGSVLNAKVKDYLTQENLSYEQYSYNILQGRSVSSALGNLMVSGTNRVLVVSENEAFVNDVVRNLNELLFYKHDIVLYSPSKIRSYNTIDLENLHALNTHVSLSYYIDYDNSAVKTFLLQYRALFGSEPSQFSYQGYDVARFFIESCAAYGRSWEKHLTSRNGANLLQNVFHFVKDGDGGFVNQGIKRVVYTKDYRISEVQ